MDLDALFNCLSALLLAIPGIAVKSQKFSTPISRI